MFRVAITRLATPIEVEATALAADLGGVAYEHRLKLNAGVPSIVLATSDAAGAQFCLSRVRARRHDAVLVSSDDIVRSDAMVQLRRFRFDDGVADDGGPYRAQGSALVTDTGERLAWADVSAVVHAMRRTDATTSQVVREKKFDAMRAAITGGLLINKTTSKTVTTHTTEHEGALYLFVRDGAPWLLRELHANYDALGAGMTLHSHENFRLTVAAIRSRVPPGTPFDERLVTRKSSPDEADLLAHIIALAAAGS